METNKYDSKTLDKFLFIIELYDKKYIKRAIAKADDLYSSGFVEVYIGLADYYEQPIANGDEDLESSFFWKEIFYKKIKSEVAAARLASAYYFGDGVSVNYEESFNLLSSFDSLHSAFSNLMLARMHHYSHGTDKDLDTAEFYYKKSISLGNKIALSEYSVFLRTEKKKLIKGYWFNLKAVFEILIISIYQKLRYGHVSSEKLRGA